MLLGEPWVAAAVLLLLLRVVLLLLPLLGVVIVPRFWSVVVLWLWLQLVAARRRSWRRQRRRGRPSVAAGCPLRRNCLDSSAGGGHRPPEVPKTHERLGGCPVIGAAEAAAGREGKHCTPLRCASAAAPPQSRAESKCKNDSMLRCPCPLLRPQR